MAAFKIENTTHLAVAIASAATTATFARGFYSLISTTDCWVITGSAPTAAANTGVYVPAGVPVEVYLGTDGHKFAAIRVTADGALMIAAAAG